MNTNYMLVKFKKNWADEFDCVGFALMTPEQYEDYDERHCAFADEPFCHVFGSNQDWGNDRDAGTWGEMRNNNTEELEIGVDEYYALRDAFFKPYQWEGSDFPLTFGIFPNIMDECFDSEEDDYGDEEENG